jgi:hypothetical protein
MSPSSPLVCARCLGFGNHEGFVQCEAVQTFPKPSTTLTPGDLLCIPCAREMGATIPEPGPSYIIRCKT